MRRGTIVGFVRIDLAALRRSAVCSRRFFSHGGGLPRVECSYRRRPPRGCFAGGLSCRRRKGPAGRVRGFPSPILVECPLHPYYEPCSRRVARSRFAPGADLWSGTHGSVGIRLADDEGQASLAQLRLDFSAYCELFLRMASDSQFAGTRCLILGAFTGGRCFTGRRAYCSYR